jgi:predicted DNA-binding transcriptional regulator YafY
MSLLERIYFFHSRIHNSGFPNASELAAEFEMSTATAHRDINYLRDRLLAPLAFDQQKNGYYYTETGFSLPFEESSKIILFLGILTSIAEEAGLSELPEFDQLRNKLTSLVVSGHQNLEQYLHCEWVETEPVDHVTFMSIINALLEQKQLAVVYAKELHRLTNRTLDPLKLLHYQGRWYLYAWCYLRQSRRLFHLSRIQKAQQLNKQVRHPMDRQDTSLTGVFGIFKGAPTDMVTISFKGQAAETVRYQQWHPEQHLDEKNGKLLLTLPVADHREIIMKVLQFGSLAEIISPQKLRKKVHAELGKMIQLYATVLTP